GGAHGHGHRRLPQGGQVHRHLRPGPQRLSGNHPLAGGPGHRLHRPQSRQPVEDDPHRGGGGGGQLTGGRANGRRRNVRSAPVWPPMTTPLRRGVAKVVAKRSEAPPCPRAPPNPPYPFARPASSSPPLRPCSPCPGRGRKPAGPSTPVTAPRATGRTAVAARALP